MDEFAVKESSTDPREQSRSPYHVNKSFRLYWRNFVIWKYFSHFVSILAFVYIVQKIISFWETVNERPKLIRVLISAVILVSLPFVDTIKFRQVTLTFTAVLLIVAIVNLEEVFGRHHSFITLYFLLLLHRILCTRTFYDNFALCISFSADTSALGHGDSRWYLVSNVFLWIYFWIVWFFQSAFKRNSLRIWEHLQVLVALKGRQQIEVERRKALIAAHFHPEFLQYLFNNGLQAGSKVQSRSNSAVNPGGEMPGLLSPQTTFNTNNNPFIQKTKLSNALPAQNVNEHLTVNGEEIGSFPLFRIAAARDFIVTSSFLNDDTINFQQLQRLNGLTRRNTALIAIKLDKGGLEDCAFTADREQNIHQMLDLLAEKYDIISIRRFGNVWIGASGFFRFLNEDTITSRQTSKLGQNLTSPVNGSKKVSEPLKASPLPYTTENEGLPNADHPPGNASEGSEQKDSISDCSQSLKFCVEAQCILQHCGFRLIAAVDYGNVLGGFLNSPHFELFGQEIRWVLKTVELREYGRILVSDTVKQLFHSKPSQAKEVLVLPEFHRSICEYPWNKNDYVSINSLSNGGKLLDRSTAGNTIQPHYHCSSLEQLSEVLLNAKWFGYFDKENLASELGLYKNTKSSAKMNLRKDRRSILSGGKDHPESHNNTASAEFDDPEMQNANNGDDSEDSPFLAGDSNNNADASSQRQDSSNWWNRILISYISLLYWYEDLGTEYKASIKERWNIHLSDRFIASYSDPELTQLLEELEVKLYEIIRAICFPNFFYLFCFLSRYQKDLFSRSDLEQRKLYQQELQQQHPQDILLKPGAFPNGPFSTRTRRRKEDASEEILYDNPFADYDFSKMWSTLKSNIHRLWRSFSRSSSKVAAVRYDDKDAFSHYFFSESHPMTEDSHSSSPPLAFPPFEQQTSTTRFYDQFYRSWGDYVQDARLFSHLNLFNLAIELLIIGAVWIALTPLLRLPDFSVGECVFINIVAFHCILSRQLDKQYERLGNTLLVVTVFIMIAFFPCRFVQIMADNVHQDYGDWGGDVTYLIVLSLRIPNHMHQPPWVSLLEGIAGRVFFAVVRYSSNDCGWPISATVSSLMVSVTFCFFYYLLQYRCYMSYVLEHHLLYYSAKLYEAEKDNTARIFTLFYPQFKEIIADTQLLQGSSDYYPLYHFRQLYHHTAIAVVHLKVADLGASLIEPRDFGKLMTSIQERLFQLFHDFGVLHVTSFSGVYLVALTKNTTATDTLSGVRRSNMNVTHNLHLLHLLKRVQRGMERFSLDNNFNVSIGISVHSGSLTLGFLGNRRYNFDLIGTIRDITVIMASHSHENGIYIAREFEPLLPSIIPNPQDSIHRQFLKEDRAGGGSHNYFLKFDGTVSGMQLQDFTYTGMLGKGGYGSVHQVTEKFTNNSFAVKVIVLKNSVMSRMIKRECIILQKMGHPNIVKFEYSFMCNNRLYLVMNFITGGNLKQVIERDHPNLLQLRVWFAELISAIEYIHRVGIIHRDIKPANCMIDKDGYLKLGDFGLSKSIKVNSKSAFASPQMAIQDSTNRLFIPPRLPSTLSLTSSLDVTQEVHEKLSRFFPLKSHLQASTQGKNEQKATEVSALVINSYIHEKEQWKKVYKLFEIEVSRVDKTGADLILTSKNVDCVFLEFNPTDDLREMGELIQDIRTTSRHTTPVYVLQVVSNTQKVEFLECGAEDCFEKRFADMDEETLAKIYHLAAYDYHKRSYYQSDHHHSLINTSSAAVSSSISSSVLSETSTTASNPSSNSPPSSSSSSSSSGSSNNNSAKHSISEVSTMKINISNVVQLQQQPVVNSPPHDRPDDVSSFSRNESLVSDSNHHRPFYSDSSHIPPITRSATPSLAQQRQTASHCVQEARDHHNMEISGGPATTYRSSIAGGVSESDERGHVVGTIHFIAPEILRSHTYSTLSDWWACGITMFYCVTRQHVFAGEDRETIFSNIYNRRANLSPLDPHDQESPQGIKNLIEGMLQDDIRNRFGFHDLLCIKNHAFFTGINFLDLPHHHENRFVPKQFPTKKFNLADKALFYGENTASQTALNGGGGAENLGNNSSMMNSYYSKETRRKLSYNKMKMELRNDYLLSRYKIVKRRLTDYRKRKIQHYSIKHQKRLKFERGTQGESYDSFASFSAYTLANKAAKAAAISATGDDNENLLYPSYDATTGSTDGFQQYSTTFFEVAYEDMESNLYSNGYYSSRQNAQLQYIAQQQNLSDSLSSSHHTDASFYSDKTIQEEDGEGGEENEQTEEKKGSGSDRLRVERESSRTRKKKKKSKSSSDSRSQSRSSRRSQEKNGQRSRELRLDGSEDNQVRDFDMSNSLSSYHRALNPDHKVLTREERQGDEEEEDKSSGSESGRSDSDSGSRSNSRSPARSRKNSLKRSSGGSRRNSNSASGSNNGIVQQPPPSVGDQVIEWHGDDDSQYSIDRDEIQHSDYDEILARHGSFDDSRNSHESEEDWRLADHEELEQREGGDDKINDNEEDNGIHHEDEEVDAEKREKLYLQELEKTLEREEIENDRSMSIHSSP